MTEIRVCLENILILEYEGEFLLFLSLHSHSSFLLTLEREPEVVSSLPEVNYLHQKWSLLIPTYSLPSGGL